MIGALIVGLAAGVAAGMLGVGGGILFVPGLVFFLGFTQVHAEATSLVAIVPVAIVGAWRQATYGNLRLRDGLLTGVLAAGGAAGGAMLANVLSQRALEVGFALLCLGIAGQLVHRGLRPAAERGG